MSPNVEFSGGYYSMGVLYSKWVFQCGVPDGDQAVFVMSLLRVGGHSAERVWKQTLTSIWEFGQPS